jgi:transcription antitermination factor NusA-like protein
MISAARIEEDFVLILRGSDISVIRANSTLSRKFEDEFQSKVWFIEAEGTDRRFIENLFFPAKVLTVNLVWLPDGNKLTSIIISAKNRSEINVNVEKIKKIAKQIRNIELLVEFENQK